MTSRPNCPDAQNRWTAHLRGPPRAFRPSRQRRALQPKPCGHVHSHARLPVRARVGRSTGPPWPRQREHVPEKVWASEFANERAPIGHGTDPAAARSVNPRITMARAALPDACGACGREMSNRSTFELNPGRVECPAPAFCDADGYVPIRVIRPFWTRSNRLRPIEPESMLARHARETP